jgi:hypothetical protein
MYRRSRQLLHNTYVQYTYKVCYHKAFNDTLVEEILIIFVQVICWILYIKIWDTV